MQLALRISHYPHHAKLCKHGEIVVDGGEAGVARSTCRCCDLRSGGMNAMTQQVAQNGPSLHGYELPGIAQELLTLGKRGYAGG